MHQILIILILIFASGCSSKPDINNYSEKFTGQGSHEVYVVSHGWHTGFIIDAGEIQQRIPGLKKRFANSRHIEFGWGDEAYYQSKEISFGLTLRAILWPTDSVIHSVAVPQNVNAYFSNSEIASLCMNDKEFSSLLGFIESSFYRDNQGNIVTLKKGIYGNSQFYKGVGDYYLMNTSNKWTAKGLKSAGMDILPAFKLTSDSIMSYLEAYDQKTVKVADGQTALPLRSSFKCY